MALRVLWVLDKPSTFKSIGDRDGVLIFSLTKSVRLAINTWYIILLYGPKFWIMISVRFSAASIHAAIRATPKFPRI